MSELVPYQFCANHQADRILPNMYDGLIPLRIRYLLIDKAKRMWAEKHAGNQPSKYGWQFDFGYELSHQKSNSDGDFVC